MWIATVEPDDADGTLKREYEKAQKRAGKVYNIVKASSLRPDLLSSWIIFYEKLMLNRGSLNRRLKEMIAVVVSCANDCFY